MQPSSTAIADLTSLAARMLRAQHQPITSMSIAYMVAMLRRRQP